MTTETSEPAHPMDLSDTEQSVLAAILQAGEATRPQVSRLLQISKPTVSAAVTRLEDGGLVAPVGAQQGSLGRSATVYAVAPGSGWLLGLDIGSTRVQVLARGLDGRFLKSSCRRIDRESGGNSLVLEAVGTQVATLVGKLTSSAGPLRAVGLALPRVIPQYLTQQDRQRPTAQHTLTEILSALSLPTGIPILLENNVNCAALAEMELGIARGHTDFTFLQVGVGIGSGIVADKKVLRGAHGGAGEVSSLPISWPSQVIQGDPYPLESYLGAGQFLARSVEQWNPKFGPAPTSTEELFDHAMQGTPIAVAALEQHGRDIGQLALSLAAVVDPELIILGGGVGQSSQLVARVRDVVHRSKPDIQVHVGKLGDRATVEGAVALTRDHALSQLLGSKHSRRLDSRTTVVMS